MAFVGYGERELSLAMLGMVDGNGHPYSWSAIFNGYNAEAMTTCPYAGIPDYLGKQPKDTFGIPGAHVTHVWTDDPADARLVAKASLVPHVVDKPEDVIGHVDAVVVATDIGHEHVARCRPFVEAGLPMFVDKPLVDNAEDLGVFRRWMADGHAILSGSAMSYTKEFAPYRESTYELGELRHVCVTTAKTWERYGIHALSCIYPILGPGFLSARNTGDIDRNVVHLKHGRGVDVTVVAIKDMYGGFGYLQMCGTRGSVQVKSSDTYYAFKAQLVDFVRYLRSGTLPFPFSETEELMKIQIAGTRSRDEGGREVSIAEIA
ncbi:MAG TPA: Gfo/Idh/MocA family oxidoreductase [Candidatus Hydrogenedentes bacterium]|nr:Gfo/Idh/MocA family oxidoreductase [Candidatus Hydrogenedentota bacterium]HPG69500.1 Gfo/Idh/MocA family oxidoreductase [Candidatus Hydrogenedentota bacterium]